MRARRFSGRVIGLLAAYLVALQVLAMPLSMPPTAAMGESLCLRGPAGDPSPHPAGHDQSCPCCAGCGLLCHAPALAGGIANPLPVPRLRVANVLAPAPFEAAPRPAVPTAQMPRGPPAV